MPSGDHPYPDPPPPDVITPAGATDGPGEPVSAGDDGDSGGRPGDAQSPPPPLSLDDARDRGVRDPEPAHAGKTDGPPGRAEVRVTQAVRRDIEGKLAFWLALFGDAWNMLDPYCAGVFAQNVDELARKATPLICQSPDAVRLFTKSATWVLWTELGIAAKPVLMAIVAHHITRSAGRQAAETGETVASDWSAYSTQAAA
jgi:hypothetical protein